MLKVLKLQSVKSMNTKAFREFLQHVLEKKSFILMVTAHWCGHCRDFRPIAQKVIKKLKQKKANGQHGGASTPTYILDMSDAAFDHVRTNHQDHLFGQLLSQEVGGFPTILQVSGKHDNKMHVLHFSEERNEENFAKFVEQASSMNSEK